MKFILTLTFLLWPILTWVQPVQAIADPPIFSCTNVIGQNLASYSNGIHGVPGDSKTYQGQDTVYKVDEAHVLQCLCPSDSNTGIQSNWWNVTGVDQDDLDFFIRRGWIFVPNGQAWGLNQARYLVKNDSYSCNGTGVGGGGSSSSNSSPGSIAGGSATVANSGSILGVSGLAATGTLPNIAGYFALSAVFGVLAYRFSKA